MNHKNIYYQLIERAKSRSSVIDYETHHILPKSLGGPNTKDNLVKLSLREHFVAHLLLTKMYEGIEKRKMYFAFYRLSNRHKTTNGRFYENSKKQAKKYLSEIHSGKTLSPEHIQTIKLRTAGENNPNYGRKHSKDNIELMSKVKIGNTNARVGISIVDFESKTHIETVESISELCKKFDLTRGQVEHYIYKQRPCNGLLFVRQKIIKRK